jgi:hypothetical protein
MRIGRRTPNYGEITPKVISAPEALRRHRTEAKIIGALEVLVLDHVAWWTHVTPSFMGHGNICKSQRTVMTS